MTKFKFEIDKNYEYIDNLKLHKGRLIKIEKSLIRGTMFYFTDNKGNVSPISKYWVIESNRLNQVQDDQCVSLKIK